MKSEFNFEILARDAKFPLARAGIIHTPHGDIATPTFAPVATHGFVKFLPPEILKQLNVQLTISNGYHLLRRAGVIDAKGGLATWNGWHGPTITDSGGFQVMSLGSGLGKVVSMNKVDAGDRTRETAKKDRLANVDDQGVEFRDPYSSRIIKFTPEMSVRAQHQIGADMMMAFDELTNISDPYEYNVEALERTRVWAERSLTEHIKQTNLRADKPYQALYGVLQGGHWRDLREKAARDLGAITIQTRQFDGFGLGGAFEKETLGETIGWMTALLPDNKPRHLLGLSQPDDIFDGVANGADTFDCVAPTREARHGRVYTTRGNLSLKRAEFTDDTRPIDETCDCPTCNIQKYTKISSFAGLSGESLSKQVQDDKGFYSRADLRALLKSPDPHEKQRAMTLLSQHNVRFVVHLFEQIRAHLIAGDFAEFRAEWLDDYYQKRSSRRVS